MEYKYKAFISYNHNDRDSRVARTLHNRIETYTVPRKLRKNGKKKLGKVFRDQEELSASSDLNQHIQDALDESEFLIVICSPGAVASRWVSKEIAYFLEHHEQEKLLTVLTGGDGREIFPVLFPRLPEPLSLDLTGSTDGALPRELKEQFLKLCAPLLGCEYDELVMRDQKRKRRQLMWWMAGIAAVAAAIISILLWSNWQIEGKNRELDQKNDELAQQNREILLRESELLAKDAQEALNDNDQQTAVRKALSALPGPENERPYYAPAEQVLFSALNLFHNDQIVQIPKDTVLEQSSPVDDFCINDDGSLLITVDPYSVVTCFDTATGEQLWFRQLDESLLYRSMQLRVCDAWDSVIVQCRQTITSLSQDTGEVLWTVSNDYFDDCFTISDDGCYLSCIVDNGYRGALSLAVISAEDGTVLNMYPLVESDATLYLSGSTAYDFSSDGRLFAGCYGIARDDQTCDLVYFVTDLEKAQTKTIYTQTFNTFTIQNCIRSLSFTDQDTTLTIVRHLDMENCLGTVDKVRIRGQKLLWQTTMPEENILELIVSNFEPLYCLFIDPYILIGHQTVLYALDAGSGEILSSLSFESGLVHLEHVQDIFFSYILKNGTYHMGSVNSYGLHDLSNWGSDSVLYLQPLSVGKLWNKGLLRYGQEDSSFGLFIDSIENGYGYAARVPEDNDHSVVIRSAVGFLPDLGARTIFTAKENENFKLYTPFICGEELLAALCTSDHSETEACYCYYLFDRKTLKQIGSISLNSDKYGYDAQILPDGTGLIYQNNTYELMFYDANTRKTELLTPVWPYVQMHFDGNAVDAKVWEFQNNILSHDHSILTVIATTYGLKLWNNEKAMQDVPYPSKQVLPDSPWLDQENLIVGANGYILLDLLNGIEDPVCDSYFLYDTANDRWYSIPFGEADTAYHTACLGQSSPLFAVMDNSGQLRIYDITTGTQTAEISVGLTSNAVEQMQWILEDRYLTIYTQDELLMIFDGTTGENIYWIDTQGYFWDPPSFAADPQEKHLYIWGRDGLCVDIDSWTLLTEIPDMVLYDPVSDRIIQQTSDYQGETYTEHLTAFRFPSTEKLVMLGREFMGE